MVFCGGIVVRRNVRNVVDRQKEENKMIAVSLEKDKKKKTQVLAAVGVIRSFGKTILKKVFLFFFYPRHIY